MTTSIHARTRLSIWVVLLLLIASLVGCGGGGSDEQTRPSYVGRYVGSFNESGSSQNKEAGTFLFTVGDNGSASGLIASFLSADSIAATGTVGANGALSNFSGTVASGGTTYNFVGSITETNGSKAATGTWTSTGGALGNRSGTWSAAPAPTTNPYAGRYISTAQDGATFDLTVANDCTVNGTLLTTSRHHRPSHGFVDPKTGRLVWVSDPFASTSNTSRDVARSVLVTIAAVNAHNEGVTGEVSVQNRELIRVLTASLDRDTSTTTELTRISAESGTMIVQQSGGIIYGTGGSLSVGDFADGDYQQGFVSFDTSGLPLTATVVSATWEIAQNATEGNPFSLGQQVLAEPVSYPAGERANPGTGTIPNTAVVVTNSLVNSNLRIDVTNLVQNRPVKGRFQLRLRFPNNTNGNAQKDSIRFTAGKLTIRYR
jgi:hypothetical protein